MEDRITVQEAARRLGVKDDAIRKRIQRGTLKHDKDPDGRVFVYLDVTHDTSEYSYKDSTRYASEDGAKATVREATQDVSYVALVEVLRTELEDWKQVVSTRDEELRRKDHIIAALTERIPELEASPEARESREATSDAPGRGTPQQDNVTQEKPSWWRRFFGFV